MTNILLFSTQTASQKKSKNSLKHLVGEYRGLPKDKKTAGDIEINSISEEKAKPSKMNVVCENSMDNMSEQGNLLWGIYNCLGVAGFVIQVRQMVLENSFSNKFSLLQVKFIKFANKNFELFYQKKYFINDFIIIFNLFCFFISCVLLRRKHICKQSVQP